MEEVTFTNQQGKDGLFLINVAWTAHPYGKNKILFRSCYMHKGQFQVN